MTNLDRIELALNRSRADRERLAGVDHGNAPSSQLRVTQADRSAEPGVRTTRRVRVSTSAMRLAGLVDADLSGSMGYSLKMLRAMVLQRMNKRGWNTLAVVSPGSGDGTTFVASNLAIAIAAEHDHTALLVDVNVRDPEVHRRFGLEPAVGIEDCLAGHAQVAAALVAPEEYPRLVLLPARRPVQQSSELLGGVRARALFRELKERYVNRFIIYDLPPMLASDDALVFAPQADAVLVVVGDNRTRRDELMRCLQLLSNVPVLGTALNGSLN